MRLTSADHAWWTGDEPRSDQKGSDSGAPAGAASDPSHADDDGLGRPRDDGFDDPTPAHPEPAASSGVIDEIADALSEYGYGHGSHRQPELDGVGDDDVAPGEHFAGELHDEVHGGWQRAETDEDLARQVLEQALFARDGLPTEDHLSELLGALGLEGDADWVDIARAHRRLVTTSVAGRAEWEQDRQRRSANEAYACLRLFHH